MQRGGSLPPDVKALLNNRYEKDQSARHIETYSALYGVSENTALFLPNGNCKHAPPPELTLIDPARSIMAELNSKKPAHRAYRREVLFEVKTPECAHGLGVMNWALHCVGVKHITEKHLAFKLAAHNLTKDVIATLAIVLIGLTAYDHDGPEDNRENPNCTPRYFAEEGLKLIFPPRPNMKHNLAALLTPIAEHCIAALTDKPNLVGRQRLEAQKTAPQREWNYLRRMGIINKDTIGTGPIGTIKYCDKAHSVTSDMLAALLGRSSNDPIDFLIYAEPRIDIISSLHLPDGYKAMFMETVERCYEALHKGPKHNYTPEEARKFIDRELTKVRNVLIGKPHVPVNTKLWSLPSPKNLARR